MKVKNDINLLRNAYHYFYNLMPETEVEGEYLSLACKGIHNMITQIDNNSTVDNIRCPYCYKEFDGREACNGDMDTTMVTCPKCGKDVSISMSIQYDSYKIEED